MIGGGRPLLRKNLADTDPPACKTPIFNLFSLVAPQPLHLAKSSITLIGSPLLAFHWTQDEYRTLPLSPERGEGSKTQNVQNLNSKLR